VQENTSHTVKEHGGLIRLGGIAILLALLIHIYVNGFLKQMPPENPSLSELQTYLADEAGTWAIVHGLRYLALVGLILFAAGLYARTSRKIAGVWSVCLARRYT